MDFELSDDQIALQEAARDLLDGLSDPARVRAHLASGDPYDAKLWSAMVEQGWLGVALPEDRGGLGVGWVEAAVLLEEIGRHTAPAPFLPTLLALDALASGGADDWVGRLVEGSAVGCVAWSRSPDAVTAEPSASGDGWTLRGRPDPVIGASAADVAVVWTPTGVFAVDLGAVGRPDPVPAMDGTRSVAWLPLEDAPAVRLGDEGAATALLDRGAVGASAEMLGGAARALEMTAQYAKDRVQFGQPIGSFQAVKHRCADMVVDLEGMRSTAWYGAWAIASGDREASVAASAAKVWCSDAAKRVMASALQVHGGIGFTWEHDLHLYLK
ncbi:MAG TPA: acyl-CoA dehydrogenase family protein, partial [Acidimicrobiales bacterium]